MDLKDITRIEHPTDRANFSRLWLPHITIYYSYETPVGFSNSGRWRVVENRWGPTTGKHLNWIDDGQATKRLSNAEFAEELAYAMGRRRLANGQMVWR